MEVRYHQYETKLEPLKLTVSRLLLRVAILLAGAAATCSYLGRGGTALAWAGVATITVWMPVALQAWRVRVEARKRVIRQLARAQQINRYAPLHVVAHSFGTVLLGEALRAMPALIASRIILVGAALPRRFP